MAIGRAPIVKMSRRMPPTPVAAPWYGSTALGWLWLSILNATARPSPIEMTPAFSPGPATTPSSAVPVGSVSSSGLRALVRAVLAPHHAEHRQLEVVRVAPAEAVADGHELLVGHAEAAMERLLRQHRGRLRDAHRAPTVTGAARRRWPPGRRCRRASG